MPIATRLALLALGVSTLPFVSEARAQEAEAPWVYGIDTAQSADDAGVAAIDEEADALRRRRAARRRPPRTRTPAPPPAPAPAPVPALPSNTTGAGVVVAIVDTGIDLDHPEFAGRIAPGGACFGGSWACSGSAALGDDDHGHGTHVAGIVAAAANGVGNTGVAPDASLLPVKVLDAGGSGSYSAVAAGISYAASSGARVINMSLGGPSPSSTLLAPLRQAASSAVIVAAAGNDGNRYAPGYPAAYATQPGVVGSMIIVGSVGANNRISSFSQTPGRGGCVTSGGKRTCFRDVFLVAPGQGILSTYPGGYAIMSGTSMATPYVSGVAAAVLGASPFLTPQQVASIMFESAIDLGARGTDPVYGRGLVNLEGALAPVGSTTIATSGATTSKIRGARRARRARMSGVLSAGIRGSQIAREMVFFDSYGRDYRTDLTAAAGASAASLIGVIDRNGRTGGSYLFAGDGFSLSGFVSHDAPNAVAAAGFADHASTDVSDIVVTARLTDAASVIIGHQAAPSGRLNALDLAASEAYDGLFMSASALNSPFVALTPDATFLGAVVAFGDGFALTAGHAQSEERTTAIFDDEMLSADESYAYLAALDDQHLRSAENTVAALSWRFAPWGVAGLNIAHTEETNSLLGTSEDGALALTADAATTSLGFGMRANLGDDWVASASWSRGETQAAPVADALFTSFSTIESEAYGLALSKRGVFGKDDSIGFAVSRPLHITSGSAVMTASTGVTADREVIYSTEVVDLAGATPETDYEIGYAAVLGEGLSLQTSAMYQQDVAGSAGADAVAGFVTFTAAW